jgi:hypothetical protein
MLAFQAGLAAFATRHYNATRFRQLIFIRTWPTIFI